MEGETDQGTVRGNQAQCMGRSLQRLALLIHHFLCPRPDLASGNHRYAEGGSHLRALEPPFKTEAPEAHCLPEVYYFCIIFYFSLTHFANGAHQEQSLFLLCGTIYLSLVC